MPSEIQLASLSESPSSRPPREETLTPAQKRGLRYQAKVEAELEGFYLGRVLLRPWFRYKKDWSIRTCQPDAVLFAEDFSRCWVIEIKVSTIPEAWHKLSTLYGPVVQKAYRIPASFVFVTRAFDPHIGWTCPVHQLEGLDRLDRWLGDGLGVVSWKR